MDTPQDGIQERLHRAERELLRAAMEGAFSLTSFDERWSTLLDDVGFAVRTKTISKETLALADSATSRVELLLECLLDFHTNADTKGRGLEQIFARMDINDVLEETPQPASSTSYQTSIPHPALPSYIEPAYRWLIGNLHNPYPSVEVKDAIALKASSYRKVIDAWFVDARKRMGWNTLRRERFSNKRIDIVDAATRFFLQEDPKRPLDPNIGLQFIAIEKRAKDLYSDKFSESSLASKLDSALKDLTPEMKAHAKAVERCRRRQEKQTKGQTDRNAQAASVSYPSPSLSSSATPRTPISYSLSEDETHLNTFAGNKRRNMSPDATDDLDTDRPNKRLRVETPSRVDATSLPSPALSFDECLQITDDGQLASPSSITLNAPHISSASRKRRLSDADGQGTPKRPRGLHVGPRVHAVSDPLPMTSTLSSWFENNFGIPSAVTVEEPESSLPLEVELYDYTTLSSIFQHQSPEVSNTPSGSPNHTLLPHLQSVATSLEVPAISEVQSYALNISTNDFNYEELYWEPEDLVADFANQNVDIINQGGDPSAPSFDLSSDLHLSSNFFNSFSTSFMAPMTDTAVVADSSTPISCNPASNVDWALPPMLLSQNTSGSLSDLGLNTISQDHSFMFNSSTMGTDALGDSISQMLAQADKATKQRKLMEMKEVMRQLELEIVAS